MGVDFIGDVNLKYSHKRLFYELLKDIAFIILLAYVAYGVEFVRIY